MHPGEIPNENDITRTFMDALDGINVPVNYKNERDLTVFYNIDCLRYMKAFNIRG